MEAALCSDERVQARTDALLWAEESADAGGEVGPAGGIEGTDRVFGVYRVPGCAAQVGFGAEIDLGAAGMWLTGSTRERA